MKTLIMLSAITLILSACGTGSQRENEQNADTVNSEIRPIPQDTAEIDTAGKDTVDYSERDRNLMKDVLNNAK